MGDRFASNSFQSCTKKGPENESIQNSAEDIEEIPAKSDLVSNKNSYAEQEHFADRFLFQEESPQVKHSKNLSREMCNSSASPSTSRKRTFSMSENDFPVSRSSTQRKTLGNSDTSSPEVLDFIPLQARRSLPAKVDSPYLKSAISTPKRQALIDIRRKSYPHEKLSRTPPNRSFHRNCATDQTPYSPVDSYRRQKRLRTALPYYNSSDLMNFQSDMGFIDSHCHLDFLFKRQGYEGSYADYQKKHKDTFPDCYKGCLAIFCNPLTFGKKHLWQGYIEEENVWASFGCHPHNAKDYNGSVEEALRSALEHPKVRALGEIGLDYSNRNNCMREVQHKVFRCQLKIALEKKLPLVIHCRDAHEDGMSIMKEMVPRDYFIHLHCFTDTWELASKWLQEFPNLFIGLTNVVTFPSAEEVHEVAKRIPLQRLLLETDAPYFIPKPLAREYPETRFSHPGMAIHVAAQVAALKGGIPLELVLHCVRRNTKKMYKI